MEVKNVAAAPKRDFHFIARITTETDQFWHGCNSKAPFEFCGENFEMRSVALSPKGSV